MKNILKRSLSMLLAIIMVMGMLPTNVLSVFAADTSGETDANGNYTVGAVFTDTNPSAITPTNIADGTEWVKNDGRTLNCKIPEGHTHTQDDCYYHSCWHALSIHNEECIQDAVECNNLSCSEHSGHYTKQTGKYVWNVTRYGGNCSHECTIAGGCYSYSDSLCSAGGVVNHYHSDAESCYTYTWTLEWTKHTVIWNWVNEEGANTNKTVENVDYGTTPAAPDVPATYKVGNTTFTFTGWDYTGDKQVDQLTGITGNTTYNAVYSSETVFTVTFNSDGGSSVEAQKIEEGKTAAEPTAPTKDGYMFIKWVDSNGEDYNFGSAVNADITLTAVWETDENGNQVPDETETITVYVDSNGNVTIDGAAVENNVSFLYDSTSGQVTVVATPASGYYVDVTVDNGAVLTGTWANKDIDTAWLSTDYRNVYTGSFTVEPGKSYTVAVTNTKYEWSLPNDVVTIWTSGYLYSGFSIEKDAVLNEIYGAGNYTSSDYSGAVDEGWDSLTIKINESCNYKITKLATDKYPAVSDNITLTVKDNRSYAPVDLPVTDYTENTIGDLEDAIIGNLLVNGESITSARVKEIEISPNELTTTKQSYTVSVTLRENYDYYETSAEFTVTADISTYTIKWDIDGTVTEDTYAYGETINAPADPSKEGHTFAGWTGWTEDATASEDVTYTASWTVNKYTLTWVVDGVETPVEYEYGAEVEQIADPAKTGYTFNGWDAKIPTTMPANDVTITAKFTINSYTVKWNYKVVENGVVVEKYHTDTLEYGAKITAYTVDRYYEIVENGETVRYYFTGWGLGDNATVPAENVEYTASYSPITVYEVIFDANGGTNVETQYIEDGKAATIPDAPVLSGYRFDGWYLNGELYNVTTPVTSDITLTAKWVKQVTVSFITGSEQVIDSLTFDIGGTVAEPDVADKANAIFDGWYTDADHTTAYTFGTAVNEDITLYVKWIGDTNDNDILDENETIVITVNGNGTITVNGEPFAGGAYIYDSSTVDTVVIVSAPVVNDGVSASYVQSIVHNETALAMSYASFAVTSTVSVADGDELVITFQNVPVIKVESNVVDYWYGQATIPYEDIYNAVVMAPGYDESFVNIEYFARGEMTHTVSVDALDLDSSVKSILQTLGITEFTFNMEALWQGLDETVEESVSLETAVSTYLTKERVNALYDIFNAAYDAAYDAYIAEHGDNLINKALAAAAGAKAGGEAVSADISDIYAKIESAAKYYGAHSFGYNAEGTETVSETIRITYTSESMHWVTEAKVTLKDPRAASFISGSDLTLTYKDYTDEDILAQFGLVDENGNPIEGAVYSLELSDPYTFEGKNVSETAYELVIKFAGNADYKPTEKIFNITIVKADASIDLPNVTTTWGEGYDPTGEVTLGNKYGTEDELLESLVEIIIGLDVADLEIAADGTVSGGAAHIQILLPQDDTLATIFKLLGLDVYGEGVTLSLNELQDYLERAGDLITDVDSGNETMNAIASALESVTGLVDLSNIEITFGGEYPTDIGVYLYGTVSTSSNYETAYDMAYLVILPDTAKVYLDWNYTDDNAVFTWQLLQYIDLGATAFEDDAFTSLNTAATKLIVNLFLGVDEEGNVVFTSDPNTLGNGAYTEMAFIYDFGNEMYYAVPIFRAFVIVPNLLDVQVQVDGNVADSNTVTFDNAPVDIEMLVDYSNLTVEAGWDVKTTLNFYGVQSNTKIYESTVAPTHAGIYVAAATVIIRDENGELIAMGADVTTIVIMPAEASVEVADKIVTVGGTHDPKDQITVGSAAGVNPDTTVIVGAIGSNGTYSENGLSALVGNVNVDFPRWVDALIAQYAPSVADGITVAEFSEKLVSKLPNIIAELEELGATEEIINSLTNAVNNVAAVLEDMPENVALSFKDDITVSNVGAYLIMGAVTDSDHIPAVDAGYLVIVPDVTQVELKWNYEDANGIFTRDLLDEIDLWAKAYEAETGEYSDEATLKITYQFIGINSDGEPVIYTDPGTLPNGAYIEVAYIALEIDGVMYISDMIARPVVIAPSNCNVDFENVEAVFDNAQHGGNITVTDMEGNVLDTNMGTLTIMYTGIQTNGQTYISAEAPVQAGVYRALVSYVAFDENGELRYYGVNKGYVKIDMAQSSIDVTGGNVKYDGDGHTANVTVSGGNVAPDHTLISGGVTVSGDISEIGVDAFHGNVNVDFPKWLDAYLAEYEWFNEGIDAAYLMDFISAYRDELIAALPADVLAELEITEAQLNAYINELLTVLEKLPEDVHITFVDGVTYTEPGYYFYYGIVTDSDHYPSADTGLLVIEKLDMDFDLTDTTVTWNGEGHMTNVKNPNNADYVTVIIDRENNAINLLLDADAQYLLDTLARILNVEFDGNVQLSTIINHYSGEELAAALVKLISEAEKLDLPEEVLKVLTAVKAELETLPASGTITINGELPSEVGEYEVYAISYSEYYKTAAAEAVLEIVPIWIVAEVESNTKYYGEQDPTPSYTVKYYDHLNNELKGVETNVDVVITRAEGENVGQYPYYVDVTVADKHYKAVSVTEDAYLEIVPAELTITVNDQNKTYGDADPELTYGVTFQAGNISIDELGVVISRNPGENVGEYTITVGYNTSNNYAVTVIDGTLTITKAALGINIDDKTKNYGDTDPKLTYTVSGLVNGDTTGLITIDRVAGENVGTYDITVTVNSNNYIVTSNVGTLTITPAQINITIHDQQITVDDALPELTYEMVMSGKVTAQELGLVFSTNAVQGLHGTYSITASYTVSDNYVVTVQEATLTITIGDSVCWNVQTGKYYKDLSDALADVDDETTVETIQMLKNVEERYVIVTPNTTLDLNGYTVTANFVVGLPGSHVIDDSESNAGLLIVDQDNIDLSEENVQIPVYDADLGGYVFARFVAIQQKATEDAENDTIQLVFTAYIERALREKYLIDGATNNDLAIAVQCTWAIETGYVTETFIYTDAMVSEVTESDGGLMYIFRLTGYSEYLKYGNVTLTPVILSGTDVIASGVTYEIPQN